MVSMQRSSSISSTSLQEEKIYDLPTVNTSTLSELKDRKLAKELENELENLRTFIEEGIQESPLNLDIKLKRFILNDNNKNYAYKSILKNEKILNKSYKNHIGVLKRLIRKLKSEKNKNFKECIDKLQAIIDNFQQLYKINKQNLLMDEKTKSLALTLSAKILKYGLYVFYSLAGLVAIGGLGYLTDLIFNSMQISKYLYNFFSNIVFTESMKNTILNTIFNLKPLSWLGQALGISAGALVGVVTISSLVLYGIYTGMNKVINFFKYFNLGDFKSDGEIKGYGKENKNRPLWKKLYDRGSMILGSLAKTVCTYPFYIIYKLSGSIAKAALRLTWHVITFLLKDTIWNGLAAIGRSLYHHGSLNYVSEEYYKHVPYPSDSFKQRLANMWNAIKGIKVDMWDNTNWSTSLGRKIGREISKLSKSEVSTKKTRENKIKDLEKYFDEKFSKPVIGYNLHQILNSYRGSKLNNMLVDIQKISEYDLKDVSEKNITKVLSAIESYALEEFGCKISNKDPIVKGNRWFSELVGGEKKTDCFNKIIETYNNYKILHDAVVEYENSQESQKLVSILIATPPPMSLFEEPVPETSVLEVPEFTVTIAPTPVPPVPSLPVLETTSELLAAPTPIAVAPVSPAPVSLSKVSIPVLAVIVASTPMPISKVSVPILETSSELLVAPTPMTVVPVIPTPVPLSEVPSPTLAVIVAPTPMTVSKISVPVLESASKLLTASTPVTVVPATIIVAPTLVPVSKISDSTPRSYLEELLSRTQSKTNLDSSEIDTRLKEQANKPK